MLRSEFRCILQAAKLDSQWYDNDISASFIAGFDMISLICRDLLPLHTDSPHTLGWPPPGIEFLLNNSFIH